MFGFINRVTLRLPNTIGVLVIALLVSLVLLAADSPIPGYSIHDLMQRLLGTVDLPATLLGGVLSFLLFAGSLHVDLGALWKSWLSVLALATLGTLLAVAMLGVAMWFIFPLVGESVTLVWCIVLGAILAPTDPVSVGGMLKRLGLPPRLQALFAGRACSTTGSAWWCSAWRSGSRPAMAAWRAAGSSRPSSSSRRSAALCWGC